MNILILQKRYKCFIDTICGRAVSRLTSTLKSLDKK